MEPVRLTRKGKVVREMRVGDEGTKCAWCGEPYGKSRCSKCSLVSYCDKDCQTQHWQEHKRKCKTPAQLEAIYEELYNSCDSGTCSHLAR